MKKRIIRGLSLLCFVLLILGSAVCVSAHGGRTDRNGGHKDNKNKSGLGYYHYHCGGYPPHLHDGGYCPYTDVMPSKVTVKAENTTLKLGASTDVSATVSPSDACSDHVDWCSSDEDVAYVSGGKIVAVGYGSATLTAETINGKKASIKVTVKEIKPEKVSVSGITAETPCYIGGAAKLSAVISPENVDDATITWSSTNPEIASVGADGTVKFLKAGSADIIATAKYKVTGKIHITVTEKAVETVAIAEEVLDLFPEDEAALTASVAPADATDPRITWTSDAPEIVSVTEEGQIRALALGQATITASAKNGVKDTVVVRVNEIPASSITIEGLLELYPLETTTLTAIIEPENATDKTIAWSVSDENVLFITQEGMVTALSVGTATITVKHKQITTTVDFEVRPKPVESIQILCSTAEQLTKGDTAKLTATVFPADATFQEIEWTTSDPEIAVVSETGILTAKRSGTVRVYATSLDGCQEEYTVVIQSDGSVAVAVLSTAGVLTAGGATTAIILKKKKHQ